MKTKTPFQTPVVAIVGRPNVGKSALFNRIAGKRIAIVDKEAGITRDRLYAPVEWNNRYFEVVDTGGLVFDENDPLALQVEKQARIALDEANAIVFVADVRDGVTGLDLKIADWLRPAGKRVILAVNKADTDPADFDLREFEKLGFRPTIPVSSLHGRGIGDLLDAAAEALPPNAPPEKTAALRLAVVGKPNVGKSSFVNALLKKERSIVSDIPGTTRDAIDSDFLHKGKHFTLVDTAGIRRKRHIAKAVDYFSVVRSREAIRRADVVALMLDGTGGITSGDLKIAAEVAEARKPCLILINKWDLLEETSQADFEQDMKDRLGILSYCPVLVTSAKSGKNIERTLSLAQKVFAESRLQIGTSQLNEFIHRVQEQTPAPVVGTRPLKIFFASQTGTGPVRFTLHVNDPKKMKPSYRNFLTNQLRKRYGFLGVPIELKCQARR